MGHSFGQRVTEREQRDELLSAYLDGQLSAGERAQLEAQLATDPAMRAELDALRHTVALVRGLPAVPVPRNFILPQAAAARPQPVRQTRLRRAWTAPILTAATAVFSLLFAVVLAGDLLLSGTGGMASAPMPQKLAVGKEDVPQEAPAPALSGERVVVTVQTEAEVVTEAEPAAEAVEIEKAVSAPTPSPVPAQVPPAAMPAGTPDVEGLVAVTREVEVATEAATGGGAPAEEPAALAPAPTPMPGPPTMEVAEDDWAIATTEATIPGANLGIPEPTPDSAEAREAIPGAIAEGEATEEAAVPGPVEQGAQRTGLARGLPWRVLEVILGLTTLGLMVVTIWAWRVRRR